MTEPAAPSVSDTWSVPISALQHYLFCPRQCALIHLEQLWTDNEQTAQGLLLHKRADRAMATSRRGVRTVTAMPLLHPDLGIHGVADAVEFTGTAPDVSIMPIEYKRGRPKQHRADEVQLCAQALCLEHMLPARIGRGALFYGEPRRRQDVAFDEELRSLTLKTIGAVREMFDSRRTPRATYSSRRCDRCSLLEDCRPQVVTQEASVQRWLERQVKG